MEEEGVRVRGKPRRSFKWNTILRDQCRDLLAMNVIGYRLSLEKCRISNESIPWESERAYITFITSRVSLYITNV